MVNIIVKVKDSNFDSKIIKPNHLVINHYEYLRKEKNLFTKTFLQKKSFVALLNVRGMLTNISNFWVIQDLRMYHLHGKLKLSYHQQLFLEMHPLYMKLLEIMTTLTKLKSLAVFTTNITLNDKNRRTLTVSFTSNFQLLFFT